MADKTESKIGDGHAAAMVRKGWHELGAAMYTGSNIVSQQNEYGIFGSITPGEVANSREGNKAADEEKQHEASIVDDRIRNSSTREERPREAGMDR